MLRELPGRKTLSYLRRPVWSMWLPTHMDRNTKRICRCGSIARPVGFSISRSCVATRPWARQSTFRLDGPRVT